MLTVKNLFSLKSSHTLHFLCNNAIHGKYFFCLHFIYRSSFYNSCVIFLYKNKTKEYSVLVYFVLIGY